MRSVENAYLGGVPIAGTTGRGLSQWVAARNPTLDAAIIAIIAIIAIGAIIAIIAIAIAAIAIIAIAAIAIIAIIAIAIIAIIAIGALIAIIGIIAISQRWRRGLGAPGVRTGVRITDDRSNEVRQDSIALFAAAGCLDTRWRQC